MREFTVKISSEVKVNSLTEAAAIKDAKDFVRQGLVVWKYEPIYPSCDCCHAPQGKFIMDGQNMCSFCKEETEDQGKCLCWGRSERL